MSEIERSKRKIRAKKLSTRIDMTPMVDLAFLLLTFFILTTTLAEEKTLDLVMPSGDIDIDQKPVNNAITLILSEDDKIFYYEDELKDETILRETNFSEVENILKKKNEPLTEQMKVYRQQSRGRNIPDSTRQEEVNTLYGKHGINVIIKYDSLARYRNTVDIIDEMEACSVPSGKYAIVKKLEAKERELLKKEYLE